MAKGCGNQMNERRNKQMSKFYTVIEEIYVEITDKEISALKNEIEDSDELEAALKELAEEKSDDVKAMGYFSSEVKEDGSW